LIKISTFLPISSGSNALRKLSPDSIKSTKGPPPLKPAAVVEVSIGVDSLGSLLVPPSGLSL